MKTPFKDKTLKEMESIIINKKIKFSKGTKKEVIDFVYAILQLNPKSRPTC